MQIVCRPSLGMNTASTDAGGKGFLFSVPSRLSAPAVLIVCPLVPNSNKYRTDPSVDRNRCFTTGKVIVASFASRSRKLAGKLVISRNANFLSAYSAW